MLIIGRGWIDVLKQQREVNIDLAISEEFCSAEHGHKATVLFGGDDGGGLGGAGVGEITASGAPSAAQTA